MNWIGVGLDGTLAEYDGWKGPAHIGKPVPKILNRVKDLLEQGINVVIFTARVCSSQTPEDLETSKKAIAEWCEKHIGMALPMTAEKDFRMVELWDDRCVQILTNKGIRIDEMKMNINGVIADLEGILYRAEEMEKAKCKSSASVMTMRIKALIKKITGET